MALVLTFMKQIVLLEVERTSVMALCAVTVGVYQILA
jgi:hypothetical protein